MTATQEKAKNCKKPSSDPAKEMLLRNSMDVLRAFKECSDEIQAGILDMVGILNDPIAEDEEKAAAADTLMEALYPCYLDGKLGIDSENYEKVTRDDESDIESALDEEENVFASNLERLMTDKNLSQKDLADKVGVGQPAIANMLIRKCRPQRRTINKLADALEVDPKTLWPYPDKD